MEYSTPPQVVLHYSLQLRDYTDLLLLLLTKEQRKMKPRGVKQRSVLTSVLYPLITEENYLYYTRVCAEEATFRQLLNQPYHSVLSQGTHPV